MTPCPHQVRARARKRHSETQRAVGTPLGTGTAVDKILWAGRTVPVRMSPTGTRPKRSRPKPRVARRVTGTPLTPPGCRAARAPNASAPPADPRSYPVGHCLAWPADPHSGHRGGLHRSHPARHGVEWGVVRNRLWRCCFGWLCRCSDWCRRVIAHGHTGRVADAAARLGVLAAWGQRHRRGLKGE